MATIGMVGLGAMGAPMARNLLKAGHTLKVYDKSEAAVDALTELIDSGETLGEILVERILNVIDPKEVESYGKACIVGEAGELEHSAALMHPTFGAPIRKAIGGGKAIIPSTKKLGGPGTRIDIPFFYKDDIYVMSHLDAMDIGLCDAPKSDEILLALAMTTGGRPHARIPGGLTKDEIKTDSN